MTSTELTALSTAYDVLIPAEDKTQAARLDEIDNKLMRGALAERFMIDEEIKKLLAEATALYGYFKTKSSKWLTITENLENSKYMDIKQRTESSGEKFTSAAADREASRDANEPRVLASFYESCMERCTEYINTAKRYLKDDREERKHG